MKKLFSVLFVFFSPDLMATALTDIKSWTQTPLERHQGGDSTFGVYPVFDGVKCPVPAFRKLGLQPLSPEVLLGKSGLSQEPITVRTLTKGIVKTLRPIYFGLWNRSDPMLFSRYICVGMFHDDQAGYKGNAWSFRAGYMFFDNRAFQYLLNLPDEMRSASSIDFLILHEFAHQLQYWNHFFNYGSKPRFNNLVVQEVLNDGPVKKLELAADCVAAALYSLPYRRQDDAFFEMAVKGLLIGAFAYGGPDNGSKHFHGTPQERRQAVINGIGLVRNLKNPDSFFISENILEQCYLANLPMTDPN